MLRQTPLLRLDFGAKSRWSYLWPRFSYGRFFLRRGADRRIPIRGIRWVTRDSNRLTTYAARYQCVIDELQCASSNGPEDSVENSDEHSVINSRSPVVVPLEEVRWNDHRRMKFVCSRCQSRYTMYVSAMTKWQLRCPKCRFQHASQTTGKQSDRSMPSLRSATHEEAASWRKSLRSAEGVKEFSIASAFVARWECRGCGESFEASIRSRTGVTAAGVVPLPKRPIMEFCSACRWAVHMKLVEREIRRSSQYLGLSMAE